MYVAVKSVQSVSEQSLTTEQTVCTDDSCTYMYVPVIIATYVSNVWYTYVRCKAIH